MLHNIPGPVLARMKVLEDMNTKQKADGMGHFERLRQIPAETGRFLALIASTAPPGGFVEIGTSGGYSGLWLSLACRTTGRTMTTYELSEEKVAVAKETFREAGVDDIVTVVQGDIRDSLDELSDIAFCFLDTEKSLYEECYKAVVPALVGGGLLLADNVVSHETELRTFLERSLHDNRLDAVVVPVGSGVLFGRRT